MLTAPRSKTKTAKHTGAIIWEGTSWIDGAPIMAVLTYKSTNRKTGNMAQVWILRTDMSPVEAIKSGEDRSICGSCIHRGTDGFKGRSCYVDVAKAPLAVYTTAKRGRYEQFHYNGSETVQASRIRNAVAGRAVRLGAYGDPALLPEWVLRALTTGVTRHTGYTHQWKNAEAVHAKRTCMASCDTAADVGEARAAGWRVFYVGAESITGHKAIPCPASDEAGNLTTCERCGLCSGSHKSSGQDLGRSVASVITILPHGAGAKNVSVKVALTIGATN